MNAFRSTFRSCALAVALWALPSFADEQTTFPPRAAIPDAFLRDVTDVVCVEFTQDTTNEVPVYTRGRDGFSFSGVIRKEETRPLSLTREGSFFEGYCYPAVERVELAGSPTQPGEVYARVTIDLRNGKQVWLRRGSLDSPTAAFVTVESLGTLAAFKDRGVEFQALRHGDQKQVLRQAPDDSAAVVDRMLFETVVLGRRVGDYAEVLDYVPEEARPGVGASRRQGWVRVVDSKGLLLIWPLFVDFEGC
ncbi:hypothetical protein [Myxococcus qinghaiensis]|uniref:hypothetical protein n=1 Tax=Myxococcus qinghaiensis TaxID=2906758 RepID=UPI0020A7A9CC|nr:hypothetical protein [Myxococcus qinghaiensis]MCP3166653.1 hypothetical protein [Myxococcus qinghaiensis]